MDKKYKNKKILVVLIAIGVIAILASSYIKYLEPYAAELSERDRDPERIEKLSLIDSALTKLRDINPNIPLGESKRVYVSVPSYSANCSGLNLPSLPDEWEYRCRPKTEFQKIDGQGWIPVDFTKLPKNFKFETSLPIDPANTAESGYYYTYVVGDKNDWVLTSLLESDKYLKETALKDGGTDPARIEVGSNLNIWAKASGLVGYWSFNEGQGETAKDLSGNGNDGTLMNGPTWIDGKVGKALSFDGVDDYVDCKNFDGSQFTNEQTITAWVKWYNSADQWAAVTNIKSFSRLQIKDNGNVYWDPMLDVGDSQSLIYSRITGNFLPRSQWTLITVTYDGSAEKMYFNSNEVANKSVISTFTSTEQLSIGQNGDSNRYWFEGIIDEVRIYNRALNSTEIQAIYNAMK